MTRKLNKEEYLKLRKKFRYWDSANRIVVPLVKQLDYYFNVKPKDVK